MRWPSSESAGTMLRMSCLRSWFAQKRAMWRRIVLTHGLGDTGEMLVITSIAILGVVITASPSSSFSEEGTKPTWVIAVQVSALVIMGIIFIFVVAAHITSVGMKKDKSKIPDKSADASPASFHIRVRQPTVRVYPSESSIEAFRALAPEIEWARDRVDLLSRLLRAIRPAMYKSRLERLHNLHSKLSELGISCPAAPSSMLREFFFRLYPLSVAGDLMAARNLARHSFGAGLPGLA